MEMNINPLVRENIYASKHTVDSCYMVLMHFPDFWTHVPHIKLLYYET